MERVCVFCGRSLGRWEKKSLYCGNGSQTVCKDCYEKYSPMTNAERDLLVWEMGRAESWEETFFFSGWNHLASGSLDVHVLRCEDCGKAEFYIPEQK